MDTLQGPLLDMVAIRRKVWPGQGQDDSGLSRNAFFRILAKDTSFPKVRVGGRVFYPEAEVRAWLAARVEGASQPPVSRTPAKRGRGRPAKATVGGGAA